VLRHLPPSIFSLVMATGIVSLACHLAGTSTAWQVSAWALFALNIIFYLSLWLCLALRCVFHLDAVRADLGSHARAPGFFTLVAATGVLGNQVVVLAGAWQIGLVLWLVAVALWMALTYTILPGLMESERKPSITHGLNGAWLLAVVATQAVSVLACVLGPHLDEAVHAPLLFVALCFWLVGGMLYIWLMSLIFYRVLFLPLAAADLTPPYWINMGAMAISTLAGLSLVRDAGLLPALTRMLPFLVGMSLLFWATATWWVPLLLALGAWRHVRQRYPLRYDPGYWAAVFPLGMYTVCSQHLVELLELPFLALVPAVFVWLALGAWALTFAGMLLSIVHPTR
jgi:tellurite resistance protein TehA-like permease